MGMIQLHSYTYTHTLHTHHIHTYTHTTYTHVHIHTYTQQGSKQSDEDVLTKAVDSSYKHHPPVNRPPKGILTVTLLDSTDLPAMDENGRGCH